jgi:hypothetical protein
MKDRFFTQKRCDRCHKELKDGRIMSMFNSDCICMECWQKEMKDEDYKKAVEAENAEIRKGNFNYEGIRGGKRNG